VIFVFLVVGLQTDRIKTQLGQKQQVRIELLDFPGLEAGPSQGPSRGNLRCLLLRWPERNCSTLRRSRQIPKLIRINLRKHSESQLWWQTYAAFELPFFDPRRNAFRCSQVANFSSSLGSDP
jgi:hypothetical protein